MDHKTLILSNCKKYDYSRTNKNLLQSRYAIDSIPLPSQFLSKDSKLHLWTSKTSLRTTYSVDSRLSVLIN